MMQMGGYKHNPATTEILAAIENLQTINGITTKIKSIEVKQASNGSKYSIVKFLGCGCEFEAKMWNCEAILSILETAWEKGIVIVVTLKRKDYNNLKSFEAEFEAIPTNLIEDGTVYGVKRILNLQEYEMDSIINKIYSDDIRNICKRFWETYKNDLSNHPAGAKVHHAFRGGWVEHVTEVIFNGLALMKGEQAPYSNNVTQKQIDRYICIALFHDSGKLFEMNSKGEYTLWGKALGHIHLSSYLFNRISGELNIKLDEEDYLIILNGILSHHGQLEYGSPVKPISFEANLVHLMDVYSMHLSKFIDYTTSSADILDGNPVYDFSIKQNYFIDGEFKKWTNRTV